VTRETIVSWYQEKSFLYITVIVHALSKNTPKMTYWITPMENQQANAINYPGGGFQDPLGLGYYSAFQDWQPTEEASTTEFSFTPSPNPSFDLDLRSLPGKELPSETSTLPNSISDDSELSPPKIEKVMHIKVF
jgi:hypothetical protein